jgi:hypothetical protein
MYPLACQHGQTKRYSPTNQNNKILGKYFFEAKQTKESIIILVTSERKMEVQLIKYFSPLVIKTLKVVFPY